MVGAITPESSLGVASIAKRMKTNRRRLLACAGGAELRRRRESRVRRSAPSPPCGAIPESGEVAPFAKLWDAQLNCARLPVAIPGSSCAGRAGPESARQAPLLNGQRLHLHQPLGGKTDHLAKDVRVGRLLNQRAKLIMSSVIVSSPVAFVSQPDPTPMTAASRSHATAP